MSDDLKLSYSAALFRVKVELTPEACLEAETPPPDLVARAKTKLEVVKGKGEIAFFVIYESRLNEAWQAMRKAALDEDDDADETYDEASSRTLVVTIGAGAPNLPGVKVERATQDKVLAHLSVDAPKDAVQAWRYEVFKLFIVKKLREVGVKDAPNNAQVFAAFMRARSGERIERLPIGPASALSQSLSRPFAVVASKARQEVAIVVRDPNEVREVEDREQMLGVVAQAVKQVSEGGHEYRVFKKEFLTALDTATQGLEGFGIDLPLILLVALGTAPLTPQKPKIAVNLNYPGVGKLSFNVSNDKMEATIAGFSLSYYDDPSFKPSVEWVENELRRCQLFQPMPDDCKKAIAEAVRTGASLDGLLATRGDPGRPNRAAYLHKSYLDASVRAAGEGKDLDEDKLDIREMQQRSTVKTGQLIAQLRFREPGAKGKDVYGAEVAPPPDDLLLVQVGENVLQQGNDFYAQCDGIPEVEAAAIALSRALIHKGDVNLRTGNIRFDGPVEIHGSIDSGATVETTGDLVVFGEIRDAFVRVQGSLTVGAGIVTTDKGSVLVRGDVKAEFIESSNVVCGGDLTVKKALIAGRVFVGKTLKVGPEGVLAGGRYFVKDRVVCSTLGFKNGAATVLQVGLAWQVARSIEIRERRLAAVEAKLAEDRANLRELVQRKNQQLTQKHRERKDELQARLQKGRPLLERMAAHLAAARANMTFDLQARVYVRETLHANIKLEVGGQPVPILVDVAAVCVLAKRRRGSHVVAIEEIEAEDKKMGLAS